MKRLFLLPFSFFILHSSFAVSGVVCNCAVCPERENDFVWENDKFGMRAYGPGEYHKWSGFDVFNKGKDANSAVEMMHKPAQCGNWHETPWKGVLDNYTMGASRGVGGIAMFADGEWKTFPDWETSRVLHTGDDYLQFELVYPAFSAVGKMTCRITLKRGERFFRNDVSFERDFPKGFVAGPGLDLEPKRDHKGDLFEDAKTGVVSLFEDPKGKNGSTMSAIFPASGQSIEMMTDHQNCRIIGFRSRTFSYYAGASWSLAGEITTAKAWHEAVNAAASADAALHADAVTHPSTIAPIEATPATYLKSLVDFLRYLPEAFCTCRKDPSLNYYGPGVSGHWAVQMNQQVAAALAILAETPDEDLKAAGSPYTAVELRKLALSLMRYSLRTHVTGDLTCTDGAKWGDTWISVLGLERSSGGFNLLEKYMTDDDKARLKRVLVHESDYRLKKYPIKAGLTHDNVPESNLWNAGVMFRTALNYPDLPQATNYLAKARKMALNALTTAADAKESWFVGPNFTRNWSLDHHGYMNVGYMYECFSNIAFLYFNCLDRGQTPPPEMLNHVQDLWAVCKMLTFPDGRLCRIGGDTRARYAYCQVFAMQAWALMAHAFGDEDAVRFERAYLAKMLREQAANGDGSYFGRRLGNIRDASWHYYCRLEADAVLTLAFNLHWRRTRQFPEAKGDVETKGEQMWSDGYHHANFIRSTKSFRSAVFRSQGGFGPRGQMPNIVCAPTARSDLAEWSANLVGRVGLQVENDGWDGLPNQWPKDKIVDRRYRDAGGEAFEQTFESPIREGAPCGEGENRDLQVGVRKMKIVAIGDGATMVIRDRVEITRETSLEHGFSTVHLMVPNDLFNGGLRRYEGLGYAATLEGAAATDETIDTRSRVLTVDDALSLVSASGASVKIRRAKDPSVRFQLPGDRRFMHPLSSLRADELCLGLCERPILARAGKTLYDETYLVTAGVDAKAAQALAASLCWDDKSKRISFRGTDGRERSLDMDFSVGGIPDPVAVSRLITEQFLSSDPLAYKPKGTDIAKHFPAGYGWGGSIFYATASLWVNALENARQFGDKELEAKLVEKFRPCLSREKEILNPPFHVDYNVVGAVPLVIARLTGDAKAKEIGLRLADFQWSEPRKDAKVINGNPEYEEAMRLWKDGYSGETRLWIDDMYMINLLQTQAYCLTGDAKYVDRAAKEMCLYLEKLQLENGLFYHAADVPFVWGRGAGWMAAGMPLVLKCLKSGHPNYAQILAGYRKMMAALLKYQRTDGLWGQLVDDPTTWGETSGSAMFAYGMAEGVAQGWLERKTYEPSVKKAWQALCGRLDQYGNISDVCIGTNKKNDRAYYLARGRINGDPHGQAPMLWLAGALGHLTTGGRDPER